MYILSLLIATVAGIGIVIKTWLIGFVLQINSGIVSSPPVRFGFPVTLSIANLFFVLGIIVIAIATMLRYQTYGIKQTLWKLIVMALLVNFGLVIAGTVLNFADQLALYFLNEISPAGSVGTTGTTPVLASAKSYWNFASAVAGAFQPQKLLLGPTLTSTSTASTVGVAGQVIGSLTIRPIASLIFTIFFSVFIIIVLGVLLIMLFVRYVTLGFLLILLPIAWASWVFPATKNHWNTWWDKFLKQAFFAPIVIFFLWVALQTSYVMSDSSAGGYDLTVYKSAANPLWGGILGFFTNLFSGTIEQLLQLSVILAIMLGGIFAANSMSIAFAGAATAGAMAVSKGFGAYVGRRAKQFGTAPVRGERGNELRNRLQQAGAKYGRLGKLLTLPVRYAGRGIEALQNVGGSQLVADAEARQKGMTTTQLINNLGTMTEPERMAALQRINKDGRTGEVKEAKQFLAGKDADGGANEARWARYQQQKPLKDIRQESGYVVVEMKRLGKTLAEITSELKKMKNVGELADTFFQDLSDPSKIPFGMTDAEARAVQQDVAKAALGSFTPNNFSRFIQKLARGNQLTDFVGIVRTSGMAAADVNPQVMDWLKKSPGAKNLGMDNTTFGW